MKKIFTEKADWSVASITECCKKNHFYDDGSDDEFSNMLNFVYYHPYDLDALETVVIDIWMHSGDNVTIQEVAFKVSYEAVDRTYFYKYMEGIN